MMRTIKPDPFHPFLILEGVSWVLDKDAPQPPFAEALEKIATSQKLSFEVWGIDPERSHDRLKPADKRPILRVRLGGGPGLTFSPAMLSNMDTSHQTVLAALANIPAAAVVFDHNQ